MKPALAVPALAVPALAVPALAVPALAVPNHRAGCWGSGGLSRSIQFDPIRAAAPAAAACAAASPRPANAAARSARALCPGRFAPARLERRDGWVPGLKERPRGRGGAAGSAPAKGRRMHGRKASVFEGAGPVGGRGGGTGRRGGGLAVARVPARHHGTAQARVPLGAPHAMGGPGDQQNSSTRLSRGSSRGQGPRGGSGGRGMQQGLH
jgi:hypothetical protein